MEWLSAAMDILTIVLAAVILPVMAWQGIVTLFGLLPRRRRRPLEDRKHRFAVVICARNEEAVIGHLIESLKAQRYPKESYRVFVIADNCTDNTAGAAEKGGATVFERFNPEKRGKGYAMRWGLQKIQELYPDTFDAVCVFDADNLAEENFLAEMNKALCSGAEVATGYLEPKNPQDSWTSGCYALYWLMMMRFYHEARNNCGLSSTITGTGFAFKLSALGEDGWNTATITEDCEFTIQQVCAGHHIAAVREAVFYDEQPVTQAVSMRQRFRWLVGTIQCGKQCLPAVWRSVRRGNWRALDMAVHVLSADGADDAGQPSGDGAQPGDHAVCPAVYDRLRRAQLAGDFRRGAAGDPARKAAGASAPAGSTAAAAVHDSDVLYFACGSAASEGGVEADCPFPQQECDRYGRFALRFYHNKSPVTISRRGLAYFVPESILRDKPCGKLVLSKIPNRHTME